MGQGRTINHFPPKIHPEKIDVEGKLDQKIANKDATSKIPSSPRSGQGNVCTATVPSIVVHNGSPTIPCGSGEVPSIEGSEKQSKEEKEDRNYMMSLGDEPVTSQHGPTMNNMPASQRPINCLPIPPPVSPPVVPPVKPNPINATVNSGSRNLGKSGGANRSKMERSLSKQDSFDADDVMPPTVQRMRNNNPKVKLLQRSHAMREETSPPREMEYSHLSPNNANNEKLSVNKTVNGINNNNNKVGNMISQTSKTGYQGGNSLQVTNNISRPNSRHKLRHQGSSQGSMDSSSPCLSRDSSTEQYTDSSGIDLSQFIADTLNRNYKDRMLMLQIEQDLISLVRDPKRAYQKFPVMSSYQRMLVHRVAAFFGMDHNVDQSGNCVVVNVTTSTRIPDIRFSELIREDCRFLEEPRRCILKRDSNSFEEGMQLRSPERQLSGDSRRSKSFEEREEEYERARKRIFNRDDGLPSGSPYRVQDINSRRNSHEDLRWHGESQPWSSSDSDICNTRVRQTSTSRSSRITKVESFEGHDTLKANSLKSSVSKSFSFGGYTGMSRGDSVSSSSSRVLMKQDSVTSSMSSTRLSPSSSGYKSQSIRSDATVSTTPSPNQVTSQCSFSPEPNTVVWAVSSLTAVPAGAVLINPATGQPYTNPDGSLYRYDPDNPIKLCPTIEEDVSTNALSCPSSGTMASSNCSPEHVIKEETVVEPPEETTAETSPPTEVTAEKSSAILINSSTSPSLPELPNSESNEMKEESKYSDPGLADSGHNKYEPQAQYQEESSHDHAESAQIYSSTMESMPVEVAQTNFNAVESENNVFNDNVGGGQTSCQNDQREYSGRNNPVTYQVNYTSNGNVQGATEYGSQPSSGAYMNTSVGVQPMNYTVGAQYPPEAVHMPHEMMYPQPVMYTSAQQNNPYGVVHAAAPTAAPAPVPAYEQRPNETNTTMAVPELSNYFMGLNVGGDQAPPATTPAPQLGYWGPSPNTSQTQGSSHSSQIQMYYFPSGVPTGTVHPKYTPTAPSMYTYNVPPMVYPTEICQSMTPSTANAVFPAPYYTTTPNTIMSYRAPTPPTPSTPSAVAAAAMAPTSFFLYHPQPAAPPAPPSIQFGMVRPQQHQVPGIRSSPPPGPRARMPYNRSVSERARHGQLNLETKTPSLHFSSPLSGIYGLRFMPGEIQSLGMMRPIANVRPATTNSNQTQYHHHHHHHHQIGSQGNDSVLTASRPPKPRKQR